MASPSSESPLRLRSNEQQRTDFLVVAAPFYEEAAWDNCRDQFVQHLVRNLLERWPLVLTARISKEDRRRVKTRLLNFLYTELGYMSSVISPPELPMTWREFLELDTSLQSTEWDDVAGPMLTALDQTSPGDLYLAYLHPEERSVADYDPGTVAPSRRVSSGAASPLVPSINGNSVCFQDDGGDFQERPGRWASVLATDSEYGNLRPNWVPWRVWSSEDENSENSEEDEDIVRELCSLDNSIHT
ncbi:hypothetical protein CC1G_03482 [Coprinopsis cinerea okayama7|uniref:Uncharacterized protein n=1 Tax=Coprinopsis cinerea (strain Okayama-7 / 130 / ATCC MYA-4618 / FGSC 9003) TaxID=240176 RepID=A8NCC4_COPC7|nr:hypothetical protein CC1G_03482 [Coprinopsis cinerea okayama7\|eukprot:XP_001832468.1 hypothetical protein CC1G_03482 [Coprinopsis cinerea okayama7\